MRERNAVKAARSVLRGGMGSNAYSLPDFSFQNIRKRHCKNACDTALWRAYSKPPVELVVADSFLWLRMECDVVRISAIFEKSTLGMDKSPVFWERNLISSGLCLD